MSSDHAGLHNLAFVGHPGSGKTTLVDALAYALGASDRKGSVADKTSILDTEPEEHERSSTLLSGVVHAAQDGRVYNLIDTPGYPEFVTDVMSGMYACETVVGVVSATSGITFNFRQKMKRAVEMGRARMIVITHLDAENASFDGLVEELREAIGEVCVPVLLPDASGAAFSHVELPRGATSMNWRKRLCDRVMDACENEETVMQYLDTETLDDDTLHEWGPRAVATGSLVPILVCNPESGLGIDAVLEAFELYAPRPEVHSHFISGGKEVSCDSTQPLLGVVFDVKSDPHVGRMTTVRILQGELKAGDHIGPGKGEKLGGLFYPVGKKGRISVESVPAGRIAMFSRVEALNWGDSFGLAGADVPEVETPELPEPMVALAVVPKTRADEQKIGAALHKLEAEDPGFRVDHDAFTQELVIHGMSDLHLQIVEQRLKRRYGVEIESHIPLIAYRETITKAAEGHHRHKKQSGGRGQFAECYLRAKPASEGSGVVFNDKVVGGSVPRNFIPAVEKGVLELAGQGILTHSEVVDVEIELYDGKFHAVDSDEASFKRAGARAFKDAFEKGKPVLLEPLMDVEIHVPSTDAGAIFSDLTSQRRGHVVDQSSEDDGHITVIQAHVPLATMQTYQRDLKSITSGEGTYGMKLHGYQRLPNSEQARVVAELGREHAEDE